MDKGINLKSVELKNVLSNTINEYKLPIVIVKYILNDLLTMVEMAEQKEIQKEVKEYKEGLSKDSLLNEKGE